MKLSIIIPVYNCEKYIDKCFESLIRQDFKDFEIIAINDGSTDNSLKSIEKYCKKYDFIKLIDKENEGQGVARNIGIKIAHGEYVTFVDSDDYLSGKDSIRLLYNQMKKNDLDLLIYNYNIVINDKIISNNLNLKENKIFKKEEILTSFLETNEVEGFSCNKIFKRDILIKNNINFLEHKKFEDIPMVVKYILNSEKIMFNNKKLYNYVMRTDSTTNKINIKSLLDEVDSMHVLLETIINNNYGIFDKSINKYLDKKISLYIKYRIKNLIKGKITYNEFKIIIIKYLKLNKMFSQNNKNNRLIIKIFMLLYGGKF